MSYIPSRFEVNEDGYSYNHLTDYEKGYLDGMDEIIIDEKIGDKMPSFMKIAVENFADELDGLDKVAFYGFKDRLVEHLEMEISCHANELFTCMEENVDDNNQHTALFVPEVRE